MASRDIRVEWLFSELKTLQDHRMKVALVKIPFVTALIGLGSWKPIGTKTLYLVLYLAPLVAVLFDMLGMAYTLSIYRINVFLRILLCKEHPRRKWQEFLEAHRISLARWSADGFTAIVFCFAIYITCVEAELSCRGLFWIIAVIVLFLGLRYYESEVKRAFQQIGTFDHKGDYSLSWFLEHLGRSSEQE